MNDMQPLPVWQARSFWYALATLVGIIANAVGVTDFSADYWTDTVMALLPLVTLALTYRERLAPTRRLTLW